MKRLGIVAASALLLLGATACSSYDDHRGKGDAPVAGGKGDDSAASCTNMPDGFPNTCTKCIKDFAPWAQVSTTSAILIMIQDPEKCGGKVVPGFQLVEGN